jgi:serine/threonine protein phosphatase PrpC
VRELIVAIDGISIQLEQGYLLIFCSDGLYNLLEDREIDEIVAAPSGALIDAANTRGRADNVTLAAVRDGGRARETSGLANAIRRVVRRVK